MKIEIRLIAFVSYISDVHISRTVLRVLEKKGFLLTTDGVSGMAAFLTGKLSQLRNGR